MAMWRPLCASQARSEWFGQMSAVLVVLPIPLAILGTIYATTMWVWMMYRAEKDWQWVLGFKHPWDCH